MKQIRLNTLQPEDQLFNYQFVLVFACFITDIKLHQLKILFIKVRLVTSISNRALPDITVRSGSPAKFQSPDSPKTGRSPSRTPDFYHLKKLEKNQKKKKKKKKKKLKIFFQNFFLNFFLFIYLAWELLTSNLCS